MTLLPLLSASESSESNFSRARQGSRDQGSVRGQPKSAHPNRLKAASAAAPSIRRSHAREPYKLLYSPMSCHVHMQTEMFLRPTSFPSWRMHLGPLPRASPHTIEGCMQRAIRPNGISDGNAEIEHE